MQETLSVKKRNVTILADSTLRNLKETTVEALRTEFDCARINWRHQCGVYLTSALKSWRRRTCETCEGVFVGAAPCACPSCKCKGPLKKEDKETVVICLLGWNDAKDRWLDLEGLVETLVHLRTEMLE